MSTCVILPLSSKFVSPGRKRVGWGKSAYKVDPQVTNWLRRHVGPGNWTRFYRWDSVGSFYGFSYTFKTPSQALLFKLTWGGAV